MQDHLAQPADLGVHSVHPAILPGSCRRSPTGPGTGRREADLSSGTAPHGDLRVAGCSTAFRRLIPAVAALRSSHPDIRVELQEQEPAEVRQLLADDRIDVGLTYDDSLVPADDADRGRTLWTTSMVLVVPADGVAPDVVATPADLALLRGRSRIGNSRGVDDELAHRWCGPGGWRPVVRHRADEPALVIEMVAAGLGVALVTSDAPAHAGVRRIPVTIATLERRTWGVTRPGGEAWPTTALLLDRLGGLSVPADQ